jgi:hypothetical protein
MFLIHYILRLIKHNTSTKVTVSTIVFTELKLESASSDTDSFTCFTPAVNRRVNVADGSNKMEEQQRVAQLENGIKNTRNTHTRFHKHL